TASLLFFHLEDLAKKIASMSKQSIACS
ncbi:hypothetical protein SLEP1_g60536, partial [Rubroshorea leprosula]